jgi:F-box and WD-40 domain protein CDC4
LFSLSSLRPESNWLRGGRLLSTHTSTDDGVVTSLAVDDKHIVIGMTNCKIHVVEAESGTFIRTLIGHELGVWCLTLVSAGGERVEAPVPSEGSDDEGREMDGVESGGYGGRATYGGADSRRSSDGANAWEGGPMRTVDATSIDATSSQSSHPFPQYHQGASFSTTSLPTTFNNISDVPGMRGFLTSRPKRATKAGEKTDQSDVCGAAKGWGQPHAMIVSGGCDRDVRVWDIETG